MVPLLSFSIPRVFKVKFNYKNVFVQSLGVFSIVMLAFLVFSRFIDFETIRTDFSSRLEITKSMFVWASFYTVFINAMVEEVFFRAYIFGGIKNKTTAYMYSSILFAVYHLTIFMTWFTLPILLIIMLGLFVGGLIFSYNYDKQKSIIAAYLVHLAADIAVILIGYLVIFTA